MTQLVINGITLPESSGGKYKCYEGTLSDQIDMISGRRVTEVRGHVWCIEWSYDYMGNDLTRQLLAALRSGTALTVKFLPDSGDDMKTSTFLCEDPAGIRVFAKRQAVLARYSLHAAGGASA